MRPHSCHVLRRDFYRKRLLIDVQEREKKRKEKRQNKNGNTTQIWPIKTYKKKQKYSQNSKTFFKPNLKHLSSSHKNNN